MPKRQSETELQTPERPSRLTAEQREVVLAIRRGDSCRVTANAGSGKTSTILAAFEDEEAEATPLRQVLFLEYNRDLKEDVQNRVNKSERLRRLVHATNYDSLLVQYYDANAPSKDFSLSLLEVLDKDLLPRIDSQPLAFNVLVIDEAQDLDDLYLRFVRKLLKDNTHPGPIQLISIGDPKQTIYRYRGASPTLFMKTGATNLHEQPPVDYSLGATFRFGQGIGTLVDALGERLFPQPYLPHHQGADRISSVQRFVLPEDRSVLPAALLDYFIGIYEEEVEPMAWLAGTTRSSNVRLWDVVEALGMHDLFATTLTQDQTKERPIANLAVRVNSAHQSKGKNYRIVGVFLTNRQTWIDNRFGTIMPEILYVALTRAEYHLVIVESADSMIFQDILLRLQLTDHDAIPKPRCAVTGDIIQPPAPNMPQGLWMQPTVAEALSNIDGRTKLKLLELIEAPPLGPWPLLEDVDLPPALSTLAVKATWLRIEHARRERIATSGLWQTLLTMQEPTSSATIYARFYAGDKNRQHRLTPMLEERLDRLLSARPLENYTWTEWLDLARFSAHFNYGHVAQPPSNASDVAACEHHMQQVMLGLAHRHEAVPSAKCLREAPLDAPGLFIDKNGILLIVLENVESERSTDRLLAGVAAAVHGLASYEIYYVRRGHRCLGKVTDSNRVALKQGVMRLL